MKKSLLIIIGCLLMIFVSACSSKGNGEATQTNEVEKTEAIQKVEVKSKEATQTNEVIKTAAAQTSGGKKTIVYTTFNYDVDYPKAKKYEKLHPNIKIELNHINYDEQPANDPIGFNEKFVKTLNTQVLSGKGPDLIDTSFLEIDQYVKHKMLVNLSDMMDKDPTFKKEQYFGNILDQVKVGGSIYGMPLNFAMEGLIGDEAAIEKTGVTFDDKSWNWSQFTKTAKDLAQKGNNKYALFAPGSVGTMIGMAPGPVGTLLDMVEENYSGFVDELNKKAYFDTALFTGTLKQVKAMYDEKIITTDSKNFNKTYFQQTSISPISYALMLKELGNAPYNYKKPKLYAAPTGNDQKSGVSFKMGSKLSINANSSVKAEAWEYIKFLLSEDSESINLIPLNKTVYDRQVKELLKTGKVKDYSGKMQEIKITEKDIQVLDTFISRAVYRGKSSTRKIGDIVYLEAKAYYAGQKSAEAVGKLIQKKVMLYLNE